MTPRTSTRLSKYDSLSYRDQLTIRLKLISPADRMTADGASARMVPGLAPQLDEPRWERKGQARSGRKGIARVFACMASRGRPPSRWWRGGCLWSRLTTSYIQGQPRCTGSQKATAILAAGFIPMRSHKAVGHLACPASGPYQESGLLDTPTRRDA
jgi:hypothetical protein